MKLNTCFRHNTLALSVALCAGLFTAPSFADNMYTGAGSKVFAVGEVVNTDAVKNGFRIPAIKAFGNGILVAAADIRYRGSNWSDLVSGGTMVKTKIATKVSYDNGATWSDLTILGGNSSDYFTLATDPTLVHDPLHNSTLIFGLRNNANLVSGNIAKPESGAHNVTNVPSTHTPDFLMYRFNTETKQWVEQSIYDQVSSQINKGLSKKYSMIFQGPGSGMFYNNKLYVPIQAFAHQGDMNSAAHVSTSGFMTSSDGGETWEVSSMIITDPTATNGLPNTSESNIFHHKGKIRLAVRSEQGDANPDSANHKFKNRLVYEYDEQSKTWTDVTASEASFIPYDVARAESSTLALNEDVYLVSYIKNYVDTKENHNSRRKGQYLTTNTGITLQLADVKSEGYTSLTNDEENIYVMYEGDFNQHDIFFKAIDWIHKDYATLNTQILQRSRDINDLQQNFMDADTSYIKGSFGKDDTAGAEMVYDLDFAKVGLFYKKDTDLNQDNKNVIGHDTSDLTFMAGKDNLFFANDSLFAGYMYSLVKYDNKAENHINSFMAGYASDIAAESFNYRFGVNGVFSMNGFHRNNQEGLNKKADFNSYTLAMTNELYKKMSVSTGSLRVGAGLTTTLFGHESFREEGGEGWGENGEVGANNATVHANTMWSNELFASVNYDVLPFVFSSDVKLALGFSMKYAYELNDTDEWLDDYRTMSVERQYKEAGELYSGRDDGYFQGGVKATLSLFDAADVIVDFDVDSIGEKDVKASLRYVF